MNNLERKTTLARRAKIVDLEKTMKAMPEDLGVDPFPLTHHFVKGCYAREILIPKDSILVGKIHKHEHFIIFLCGDVTISSESGKERVTGSKVGVSPAGIKRAIYAHEDSRIITIHLTEETDLEKIENDVITTDFISLEVDQ